MDYAIQKSKVYIQTDEQGRITRCEGGYTTPADLTGWTEIDEGTGDKYNLCQSHYFDGGLYTMDGICRYQYIDGAVGLRSEDDIAADRAALPVPEKQATVKELSEQLAEQDALLTALLGG